MRGRARPIPRGRPVEGHAPSPLGVSRVALDLHVPTCRRHYPGGPLGSDRSWDGLFQPLPFPPQRRRPSPSECEVGVHIGRFEACSTFTCVTACRLAASPKRHICLEGSDGFVTSTVAPIATGWSDPVAGWELHPLKNQHLFTAHTRSDPAIPSHLQRTSDEKRPGRGRQRINPREFATTGPRTPETAANYLLHRGLRQDGSGDQGTFSRRGLSGG